MVPLPRAQVALMFDLSQFEVCMGVNAFVLADWERTDKLEARMAKGTKYERPRSNVRPTGLINESIPDALVREKLLKPKSYPTRGKDSNRRSPAELLRLEMRGNVTRNERVCGDRVVRTVSAIQRNAHVPQPKRVLVAPPTRVVVASVVEPTPRFYLWPSRVPVY
jgi:hypothetical protein